MEELYVLRGYTDVEMAARLNVNRQTVHDDRRSLATKLGPEAFEKLERGRYKIRRHVYLSQVSLTLFNSLPLYLFGIKSARQLGIAQPHMVTALEKLALCLRQPMAQKLVRSAELLRSSAGREQQTSIFETVALAWAEQRRLDIDYVALGRTREIRHTVDPYLIEPSVWSDAVYVIGRSEPDKRVMSFKLDRIKYAYAQSETFEFPVDFDDQEFLRHAWGVWTGEGEPQQVVLRFTGAEAIQRLRETRWHPLEQVVVLPDARVEWQAPISQWREMLPWVRGWGSEVEVVSPKDLRDELQRETAALARIYLADRAPEQRQLYYAHSKREISESQWQPLIEHLTRTAEYAKEFGQVTGERELSEIAGLAHDIGKYSNQFQRRLRGSTQRVDHSTAGAKELITLFSGKPQELLAWLLAYCISGHHSGLLNYGDLSDTPGAGTLLARLKTGIPDYSAYKSELGFDASAFPRQLHIRPQKTQLGFSLSFMTRMIFSALVDADFQETEEYMEGRRRRGAHADIAALCNMFNEYVRRFDNPMTEIDRIRTGTLRDCVSRASDKQGFFKLTVPTGGGKTLASMAFALNHAATHGLRRVIYVIPFTSIIEQNAGVFKEILGEENVLEHHSNFDWEGGKHEAAASEDQTNSTNAKLRLAAENWDVPVVVTTNVQFFESLFAAKSSRCRKLHNIAKSVVVFDEAQMFPKDFMTPAMSAVWELVYNYGCSAVFCTATQPKLERFLPEHPIVSELVPDPQKLFNFYKRVDVKSIGVLTDEALIKRLHQNQQVLCIVNTRKHASGLFQRMEGEGNYHLSTLMCPAHRRLTLMEIRSRLASGQICRVVSTSVMEAGIDVDFPTGYRALAGLDSINQAAGRVNRNMKRELSELFVFEPDKDLVRFSPRYVAQGVEVTRSVLRDHVTSPISIPAIDAYFERLYSLKDARDFDIHDIANKFSVDSKERPVFQFAEAAEKFHIIEDVTHAVIIPFDEVATKLIEELKHTPYPAITLRKLQPYTVAIHKGEYEALNGCGAIEIVVDSYSVLRDVDRHYHPRTGVVFPANISGNAIIA
jgi:CRISPR-associated endonuclease/helicase Cas3